ncbi:hypothetical protein [Pseudomonas sp. URMO17WK12:I4]|uniref:hypothetical protein n=1 Tax=Pseudomonas sp. URMO17WK12:I4 TaxID=1283292 RepID=UPI0012DBD81E|nr:hypothetical protein [Pseudomonas sp. URMO17WK12:I4]
MQKFWLAPCVLVIQKTYNLLKRTYLFKEVALKNSAIFGTLAAFNGSRGARVGIAGAVIGTFYIPQECSATRLEACDTTGMSHFQL